MSIISKKEEEKRIMKQLKTIICLFTLIVAFSSLSWAEEQKAVQMVVAQKEVVEETTRQEVKKDFELEEMVITGTRVETPLSEVPGSINIITAEEIKNRARLYGADEAVNTTPGVCFVRRKGIAVACPIVTVRGLQGIRRNLFLVDGLPIKDFRFVPLENVERIEVARGPFSSLYGGGAMGSVMNIITKRPPAEAVKGSAHLGFEENNTQIRNVSIAGRKGKIDFSLNARHRETDGYLTSFYSVKPRSLDPAEQTTIVTGGTETTDKTGNKRYIVGDSGKGPYQDESYDIRVGFEVTPQSYLRLNYTNSGYHGFPETGSSYLRDSNGNVIKEGVVEFQGTGMAATIEPHRFRGWEYADMIGAGRIPTQRLAFAYDHELGLGELKTLFGYSWGDGYRAMPKADNKGLLSECDEDELVAELQMNIPIANHALVIGVNLNRDKVTTRFSDLMGPWDRHGQRTKKEETHGKTSVAAVFAQGEIKIFEPLSLYLGGRYDYWKAEGSFWSPTAAINYSEETDSAVSPKIALVYKPFGSTTLRTSYGKTFRGPVADEKYRTWETPNYKSLSNPELGSETVDSWEVNIDQLIGDGIRLTATYFDNKMKDLIHRRTFADAERDAYNAEHGTDYENIDKNENIGKAESNGVELGIEIQLMSSLSAFANYTYTNSEVLENISDPESVGKKLTMTPEDMWNIGVNYIRGGFSSNLTCRYVDKAFTLSDNTDTVKEVPGSYDSRFVVDARLGYKFDLFNMETELSVYCNNLFNEEYYVSMKAPERIFGTSLNIVF